MKVLIANRGEIAIRIARACREMGLGVVAVYSDCDRGALHVRMADVACRLGPGPAADSYLRIDRLVEAAVNSGATFVHPGYGFLAENAGFASACEEAGLVFVGPTPDAIARMGNKTAAREVARRAGVPLLPGTDAAFDVEAPDEAVRAAAESIGYPLLIKAVAGGGGKGMRTVGSAEALLPALGRARSEAVSAFGDGRCYLERRLIEPRHIEVQLLADRFGTVVPFVERECSIQRRHQKVVEESPATDLPPATRRAMAEAAASIAREVGYISAGTIEFLVDRTGAFYFLEMNTRLQVEHPVTEAVTRIDLVQWQLRIARGQSLDIDPVQALTPNGHAIECRIYAEDPDAGFLPSPGCVTSVAAPAGPGIRDDRGVESGDEIPIFYDSLIAKLTAWGPSRGEAIGRLGRALDEYRVTGVRTTLPFFRWLVRQPIFVAGQLSTAFLDDVLATRREPFVAATPEQEVDAAVAAAVATWLRGRISSPPAASASRWRTRGLEEHHR